MVKGVVVNPIQTGRIEHAETCQTGRKSYLVFTYQVVFQCKLRQLRKFGVQGHQSFWIISMTFQCFQLPIVPKLIWL